MLTETKQSTAHVSGSGRASVDVDPDDFLDLIRSDPTQAFRLIFPDYPANRKPSSRITPRPSSKTPDGAGGCESGAGRGAEVAS